jgi:hypothetical protein
LLLTEAVPRVGGTMRFSIFTIMAALFLAFVLLALLL